MICCGRPPAHARCDNGAPQATRGEGLALSQPLRGWTGGAPPAVTIVAIRRGPAGRALDGETIILAGLEAELKALIPNAEIRVINRAQRRRGEPYLARFDSHVRASIRSGACHTAPTHRARDRQALRPRRSSQGLSASAPSAPRVLIYLNIAKVLRYLPQTHSDLIGRGREDERILFVPSLSLLRLWTQECNPFEAFLRRTCST